MFFLCLFSDPGKELKDLPVSLLNKAKELSLDNEENLEGYSLGQTIHVKGKVKIFRENKEIVALYHSILCMSQDYLFKSLI